MKITDEDILKYCDGAMQAEQAARMREAAQHDSDLAYRIRVMEASQLPYEAAFAEQSLPEVPEALTSNLNELLKAQSSDDKIRTLDKIHNAGTKSPGFAGHTWRTAAVAASLALCFFLGYNTANHQGDSSIQEIQLAQSDQAEWVRRVADYQTLYVENTVAGIVDGDEKASSLFRRLESSTPLHTGIPDLSEHGYTFVRAQELGYKGDPLVQLVYSKLGQTPLALCFMHSSSTESADLQIGKHEALATADWIQNGQRFVIVGEEPGAVMQSIYDDVRDMWL